MKKTKSAIGLTMAMAAVLAITACSGTNNAPSATGAASDNGGDKKVKISFLNSKGEILSMLEDAAKVFQTENPNITVEIIQTSAGQSAFEKASSLYASGNPTTIMMQDTSDVAGFKERVLDLSNEKWVADVREGALETSTVDGKVMGFPFAMEGYALIYNKQVLDKAIGGSFDPASVKTTAELDSLLQKVEASGVAGAFVSSMDWSLGSHMLPISITTQSKDQAERSDFIASLKSGSADLANNKTFNGLLDTFDVLSKYNLDKASPLSSPYEKGAEVMGKGQVGVWFMGNWAWPQLKEFDTANGEYGFMPLPVSNNKDDYGNSEVTVTVTKDLLIDKEKSSPEQQEAAKKFLNWLVYESNGQDFLVNKASIIPAFSNIKLEMKDPLSVSLLQYMEAGKFMPSTPVPADYGAKVGGAMQKYLAKAGDRAELIKSIENYWKSVK